MKVEKNLSIGTWRSDSEQMGWNALTEQLLVTSPKSREVVNTMRAGALGRMQELGLVRRERDGRRVRYHVRRRGERLG